MQNQNLCKIDFQMLVSENFHKNMYLENPVIITDKRGNEIKLKYMDSIGSEDRWIYVKSNNKTKKEAEIEIFEYIEMYYNSKRLHSSNNYRTPNQVYEEFKVA